MKELRIGLIVCGLILVISGLVCLFSIYTKKDPDQLLIPVCNEAGKWGYIDRFGRVVIGFQWTKAQPFKDDGLAWVRGSRGKWGAIKKDGSVAVELIWHFIEKWHPDGYAWAKSPQGVGYAITREGKELFRIPHSTADTLGQWHAKGVSVISHGSKFGVIDRMGNIRIPTKHRSIKLHDEHIEIKTQDNQTELWNYQFERVKIWVDASHSHVFYYLNAKRNRERSRVIKEGDFPWDHVRHLYDDCLVVRNEKKYGMVDSQGQELLPAEYDSIKANLVEHLVRVKKGTKRGLVDRKGKTIVPIGGWEFTSEFASKNLEEYMLMGHKKLQITQQPVSFSSVASKVGKESVADYKHLELFPNSNFVYMEKTAQGYTQPAFAIADLDLRIHYQVENTSGNNTTYLLVEEGSDVWLSLVCETEPDQKRLPFFNWVKNSKHSTNSYQNCCLHLEQGIIWQSGKSVYNRSVVLISCGLILLIISLFCRIGAQI